MTTDSHQGRAAPQVREVLGSSFHSFDRSGSGSQGQQAQEPSTSTKSYAEQNPEFISINLLSDFQFYDFKTLSCRTLLGVHQAKIHRAHKEKRYRYVVEGIGATLEPGRSAFDLTPGDFYFLMYWQRVNSYDKTPMIVPAHCTDVEHNRKVIEKELPEDTLFNEVMVNSTTLDSTHLPLIKIPQEVSEGLQGFDLHVETMHDVIEKAEALEELEDGVEEYLFLADRASFLRRTPDMTLARRCEVVGQMTMHQIDLLDRYIDLVTNYGVEESTTVRCKECGGSRQVVIAFDPLTFLPGS